MYNMYDSIMILLLVHVIMGVGLAFLLWRLIDETMISNQVHLTEIREELKKANGLLREKK